MQRYKKSKTRCNEIRDGEWVYNSNYGWIISPEGPWYLAYDNYRIPTPDELKNSGHPRNYYQIKSRPHKQ